MKLPPAPRSTQAEPPANTLLLVDDEPNVVAALRRQLRGPWTIHAATGGAEGLAILERTPCAVVVSDLHMPEMDGIEFFTALHESQPDTIRIMLTGDVDRTAVIRAVNQGHIFRFLNKPCPPEAVQLAVADAMAIHELRRNQRRLEEQKLADATRLAHAGQLAGALAGQLDQVIRLVQSNTLIANLYSADPNVADALRTIERILAHGHDLTRQLTRACAAPAAPAPPPGLVDQLAPMLTRLAGNTAPLEIRCEDGFDCGDISLPVLGQITAGLIQHGHTLTPGRGRFRVGFSTVEISPRQARAHPGAEPGLHLLIEVANAAGGTTRETADTLFRPLQKPVTNAGAGAEVLDEVGRVIRTHHGWTLVRSAVGKGTSVQVHLPKHRSSSRATPEGHLHEPQA